ncbi:MAG: phosphatase PAP2 family protein [Chlamydiota bacterium]
MIDSSGLSWIYFLHQFRSPMLDATIKFLNFFDRQEFFFIFIPVVWLCYRWQLGRKIFYLFLISNLTNLGLKALFAKPRPFRIDPSVGIIHVDGYSFPSGAAQSAILIAGLLIYHWKSRWKWPLAMLYLVSISFSRIYLGVHFPLDILGGWAVGLILWGVYVTLFPRIERLTSRYSPALILIVSQCVFFSLMIALPSFTIVIIAAAASGIEWGIFLNKTFFTFAPPPINWPELWIRAIIGPAGIFILYISLTTFPFFHSKVGVFALFFLIGLWMSTIANAICNKIALRFARYQ